MTRASPPPRASTSVQLRALVSLRWRMIRSRWARLGLVLLGAGVPLSGLGTVAAARQLPGDQAFGVALVTPTLFLIAAVAAVLAPLAAGGGNELYPADQLSPYPVRPATVFAGSLLLAPLNLAWLAQLLAMLGAISFITRDSPRPGLALGTALGYLACVTVAGQAVAWWVVGVRQTRAGRTLVWVAAAATGLAVAGIWLAGAGAEALDRSPTTAVVVLVLRASADPVGTWAPGLAVLGLATVLSGWAGTKLCSWALARGHDAGVHQEARPVRRRAPRRTAFAELTAVDRASVWRSVPMRRGIVVLGVLPGAAAAAASVDWPSIVLLPGLVAAGAGLLFGVNAFCLDASGAIWLASLPHDPRLGYFAKTRVLAEVCLAAVLVAVLAAAIRAPQPPTLTQVAAVLASVVACTASVVATCMSLSVHRPHRADLRGARDTPAPPGSLAVYSVRLSVITTLTALTLSLASHAKPWPWLPLLVAVPLTVRAALATLRVGREWAQPLVRAQVVTTVASG
jgi:hypothetical protein